MTAPIIAPVFETERVIIAKIVDFLKEQSQRLSQGGETGITFFPNAVRFDSGELISLPVAVRGGADDDAYSKAILLQTLEDAWNESEPTPRYQLLLVPVSQPQNGVTKP